MNSETIKVKNYFASNITKTSWALLWTAVILEGILVLIMGLKFYNTNIVPFLCSVIAYSFILIISILREIFYMKWKKRVEENADKLLKFSSIYGCLLIVFSATIMVSQTFDSNIGVWFVISNIIIVITIPIIIYIKNLWYIITIVVCFVASLLIEIITKNLGRIEIHTFVYIAVFYLFSIIMQYTLKKAFLFNYDFQKKAYETAEVQIRVSQELLRLNEDLRHESLTDSLTQLGNRNALEKDSRVAWEECHLEHKPLSVVMIDVDNFKQINDSFGHTAGDGVLRKISQMLNENSISNNGLAYRYGGEEFLMIFKGIKTSLVNEYMQDLCANVETTYFSETSSGKISISFGIYDKIPDKDFDFATFVTEADRKMYRNKNAKLKTKKAER